MRAFSPSGARLASPQESARAASMRPQRDRWVRGLNDLCWCVTALRRLSESFSPVCLPKFNASAFVYAYVGYLAPSICLVRPASQHARTAVREPALWIDMK